MVLAEVYQNRLVDCRQGDYWTALYSIPSGLSICRLQQLHGHSDYLQDQQRDNAAPKGVSTEKLSHCPVPEVRTGSAKELALSMVKWMGKARVPEAISDPPFLVARSARDLLIRAL